ncbi:hypothetical protein [Medusavirus stheno T3]|uniref:HNH endonuclease n=1 Tax=Medusavirus stheno T3 TaxID=3069717 RepID=A0A7S7YEF9_9VIRU|nr:hypothetical protein QKU73_gp082 [Acanthamoeba castellanii medusavirus]QPB44263.1 hypothetical protein [Medusavirus stheno T3]
MVHVSQEKFEREVAKTQLRCSICHRKKTYRTTARSPAKPTDTNKRLRERNAEYVRNRKFECGRCELCGLAVPTNDPQETVAFDYDHLDRTTKKGSISQMAGTTTSKRALEEEIAKCRLLCANCHRKHTKQQLGHTMYGS